MPRGAGAGRWWCCVSLGVAGGIAYAVVDDVADQLDELQRRVPRGGAGPRAVGALRRGGPRGRPGRAGRGVRRRAARAAAGRRRAGRPAQRRHPGRRLPRHRRAHDLLPHPRAPACSSAAVAPAAGERRQADGRPHRRRPSTGGRGTTSPARSAMSVMAGLVAYALRRRSRPARARRRSRSGWRCSTSSRCSGVVLGALPAGPPGGGRRRRGRRRSASPSCSSAGRLFEALCLQRRVEARSLHIGPFVTRRRGHGRPRAVRHRRRARRLVGPGRAWPPPLSTRPLARRRRPPTAAPSVTRYRRRREDLHPQGRRRHHRPALRRPGPQGRRRRRGPTAPSTRPRPPSALARAEAEPGGELDALLVRLEPRPLRAAWPSWPPLPENRRKLRPARRW